MPNRHEKYAKEILRAVFGNRFSDLVGVRGQRDPNIAGRIIDGVIDGQIAVEITRGTAKHIAGEACVVALHSLPYKLLIVLPGGAHDDQTATEAARHYLRRILNDDRLFRIVLFAGSGAEPKSDQDESMLRSSLEGWP